jgi:hypothetical protein
VSKKGEAKASQIANETQDQNPDTDYGFLDRLITELLDKLNWSTSEEHYPLLEVTEEEDKLLQALFDKLSRTYGVSNAIP